MRITDAVKADSEFRLWRKAQTLSYSIDRRLDYYHKNHRDKLSLLHILQAIEAQHSLRLIMSKTDGEQTEIPEINSLLSSRKIMKRGSNETLKIIFDRLPEPSAAQLTDFETQIVKTMTEKGKQSRGGQHKTLLAYEIAYRTQMGWYVIFNTLTVAPGHYTEVFHRESTAWKQYIRDVTKLTGPTHTYFAAVEEGAKNNRLHIHVVHMFQNLPKNAQDPNKGKTIPNRTELTALKSIWPYGYSAPIIVRFSNTDAWSKSGYRWPLDTKTGQPRKFSNPLQLANYLSKYITKSYIAPARDKYLWRIRKSHNLGIPIIEELLSTLNNQELLTISTNETLAPKMNNKRIPPAILRLTALKMYKNQSSIENQEPTILTMGKKLTPRHSPLTSSRDSTPLTGMSSRQNIGAIQIKDTNIEDTFKEAATKIKIQAEIMNDKYFGQPSGTYGTTSTRDYIRK